MEKAEPSIPKRCIFSICIIGNFIDIIHFFLCVGGCMHVDGVYSVHMSADVWVLVHMRWWDAKMPDGFLRSPPDGGLPSECGAPPFRWDFKAAGVSSSSLPILLLSISGVRTVHNHVSLSMWMLEILPLHANESHFFVNPQSFLSSCIIFQIYRSLLLPCYYILQFRYSKMEHPRKKFGMHLIYNASLTIFYIERKRPTL